MIKKLLKSLIVLTMISSIVFGRGIEIPATPGYGSDSIVPGEPWSPTDEDSAVYSEGFEAGFSGWTGTDLSSGQIQWHPDEFNAFQGNSWWCGDPAIGGYNNSWLQYLVTPSLDLSAVNDPVLSFKLFYEVEPPAGASTPYDGWDGCNVWLSTNGGASWEVISPENPAYNCQSLYSFGFEWGMGEGIAGWGGSSGGWVDAEFNLEAAAGYGEVQLRFAMCSDPAYSTPDDPSLISMFVDNVVVADGGDIILQNDADGTAVPAEFTLEAGGSSAGDWWIVDNSTYYTGSNCATCVIENHYGLLNGLESPWISLPDDYLIHYTFAVWCDMLDWDGDGNNYLDDFYKLEFTTDGINWAKAPYGFHDYGNTTRPGGGANGWEEYLPGMSYNNNVWMDISALGGQDFKFRFVVVTDDNDDGGIGSGLHIDDVTIWVSPVGEEVIPIALASMNDENGYPVHIDQPVMIEGVVSVSDQFGYSGPAYIQDESGAIAFYEPISQYGFNIGDMIRVTGWVGFYAGLTQIVDDPVTADPPVVEILSSGNPVGAVTGNYIENENWESHLMRIQSCQFQETGTFAGNVNYSVDVEGGGTIQVRIDTDTEIPGSPIPEGIIDIVGVQSQYDNSSPYFEGYQLLPRFISDFIPDQGPATNLSGPLSGTITAGDYTIIGEISIPAGDSLIIEAGVDFIFNDGVRFDISGYLHAAGTESDSIKFMNSPGLTWGGIGFYGSAADSSRLEYCLITGAYSPDYGGGIYCWYYSPLISNCTISGNSALTYGGGIYCTNSSPSISSCTISGNSANWNGGGIYCNAYSSPAISNCTISGNSVSYGKGGGIYCDYSSPSISKCAISGNTADEGGGVHCDHSDPTLTNCTISGNTADEGGGVYCVNADPAGVNNIIWENSAPTGSQIHIINGSFTCTYSDIQDGWTGTGNINTAPLFVNAGSGDYHLTAGSPCIDAGDPASPLDPDNTIADMGAFYFEGGAATPIAEVRANDENGYPLHIDEQFTFEGLVTTTDQCGATGPAYLEDGTAGVALYDELEPMGINIGDLIRVTGWVGFYAGLTEIVDDPATGDPPLVEILSSGTPVIPTVVEDIYNEVWEGMLVRVPGCQFIEGGVFGGNVNYAVELPGGGTITVRIDVDSEIPGNPIPTEPVDIIGNVGQYDSSSPYFDGYQLLPRFISDFIPLETEGIETNFRVDMSVQIGNGNFDPVNDNVVVRGSTPELGNWNNGPELYQEAGTDIYSAWVQFDGLSAGSQVQFKYVIQEDGNPGTPIWEQIDNRMFEVSGNEPDNYPPPSGNGYGEIEPELTFFGNEGGGPTPIAEVRMNNEEGFPLNIDQMFTIEGILTVDEQFNGPAYLQDETGGIALYDSPISMFGVIGDQVRVTGWVGFYAGLTEFVDDPATGAAPVVEILSSGNPVEPRYVPMLDEMFEGQLLLVQSCQFLETGTFAGNVNYNVELYGGEIIQVRIDTDTDIPGNPIPEGLVNIVGVEGQYDLTPPYFEGYQLIPRFMSDITPGQAPSTYYVPGDFAAIQDALDAAINGDEIIVSDGIYAGTGNKDLDFLGKALMLRSEHGPDNCIIDCQGEGRGFYFHSFETPASVLDGFTIRGGQIGDDNSGGGIYVIDSSPAIINCHIIDNYADFGGGIFFDENSSGFVENCHIGGNSAKAGGGAYCRSFSSFRRCTFTDNHAIRMETGGNGGGIYCWDDNTLIENCTFEGNIADNTAAGIRLNTSHAMIRNSIVANSIGGIAVNFTDSFEAGITFCDFYGNQGGDFMGEVPEQLGVVNNTNANGDDCDSFFNLFLDPMFVDPASGILSLTAGSPCIDAGDPGSPYDPDGTVADMGAFYYDGGGAVTSWSLEMTATGEEGTAPNEFTVNIGGDEAANFLPAPPPPPQYMCWAQLWQLPEWNGPYSEMVYVWNEMNEYEWTLEVDPNGNAMPPISRTTVISWNPGNLPPAPENWGFFITNDSGSILVPDMSMQSSYDVTGESSAFLHIKYGQMIVPFEYNLAQYWNLISLPVIPADNALAVLFPNATVAYEFAGGTYVQSTALDNGKAYWLYVPEAEMVTVMGMPFTEYTVEVNPPWEMLGSVAYPAAPSVNPGSIVVVYNFNQTYYQVPDFVMLPGAGYWVNMTGDVEELTLSGAADAGGSAKDETGNAEEVIASADDWSLNLLLTGEEGVSANTFSLTIGNGEAMNNIPAPPAPPQYSAWGELYSEDWSAGPYFEMIQPAGSDISIWLISVDPNGNANPPAAGSSVLSWDAESIPATGMLSLTGVNGEVLIEDMRTVETLEISGTEAVHYEIVYNTTLGIGDGEEALPSDYTLYQNMPNPFNPATQIKYYLLEAGKVKVTVFNIMGEEVAVLANGVQNQGFHTVSFEASNLTSGVYFYRIQAGDFTGLKKMVLIK